MKKLTIIYLVLFVMLLLLPAVTMPLFKGQETTENRELSDFPNIKNDDGKLNSEYTDQLDTWISEHIGFRSLLVEANSTWQSVLFGQSSEDSVIVGDDDWLFYAETESDYLNVATLSNRNVNNIVHTLELMQEYTEKQGAVFVATVIPNKNTVYPDNMPYYYIPLDSDSNLDLLEKALASSNVNYADVRGAILKSESDYADAALYQKYDSHWDYRGALVGYRTIMEKSGYPHNNFTGLTFESKKDWNGDLASMLYADAAKPDVQYYPEYDFGYEVISHETGVEAIRLQMYNQNGQGSLVMFRDSFCNAMQVYLAESFEETLLSRAYPFSMDYVNDYAADVCIMEIVERNLPNLAKKAPVMQAPEVLLDVQAKAMKEGAVELNSIEQGSYHHLYGTIDKEYLGDEYQVFLLKKDDENISAYEAFPVFEQELLDTKGLDDNGFSVYIRTELITETTSYSILVYSNGEYYATGFIKQ